MKNTHSHVLEKEGTELRVLFLKNTSKAIIHVVERGLTYDDIVKDLVEEWERQGWTVEVRPI